MRETNAKVVVTGGADAAIDGAAAVVHLGAPAGGAAFGGGSDGQPRRRGVLGDRRSVTR